MKFSAGVVVELVLTIGIAVWSLLGKEFGLGGLGLTHEGQETDLMLEQTRAIEPSLTP